MKRFPALSALLALLCSCCANAGEEAKHVNAEEAARVIAEGKVVVIDVRTPEEFAGGYIAGARNINIASPDFKEQVAKLDQEATYLLHCQAGGRSLKALKVFQDLGFQHLIHLDDGFMGWEDAGKPVAK